MTNKNGPTLALTPVRCRYDTQRTETRTTKAALYELIRRRHIVQGQPIRAIARQFGIHRRVVRAALHDAVPEPRKKTERPSPGPWLVAPWTLLPFCTC
ncbi:MAG: GntR family transcriptional regulator [Candidatus Sericytochromatia bacterium]|nr:GntR family transcriptional regulator [Candidatus Sericytochromatia bacterium]